MAILETTGVEESDGEVFKTLPAGEYNATVVGVVVAESKNPDSKYCGSSYLRITFNATDEDGGMSLNVQGLYMMPCKNTDAEAQRRDRAKLKCLQVATDTEDMGNAIDTDRFMHAEVRVIVSEKEGQRGPENSVQDVLPA